MSEAIFILTGTIQSGKTTSLMNWSAGKKNIRGILTPVIEGKRFFFNISTRQKFPMEAAGDEEKLAIGKYQFSKKNFDKAISVIRQNIKKPGWLVIDEIGPLELKGEAFAPTLKEVLDDSGRDSKLLLVIRESILMEAIRYFDLHDAKLVRNISEIGE
jgi:nucleoside-triphosphatase THEP1